MNFRNIGWQTREPRGPAARQTISHVLWFCLLVIVLVLDGGTRRALAGGTGGKSAESAAILRTLRVYSAIQLCHRHPGDQYMLSVQGYFERALILGITTGRGQTGHLYHGRVPNDQASRRIGPPFLLVENHARAIAVRWVTLQGRLVCSTEHSGAPATLFVTRWKAWADKPPKAW